MRPFSHPGLSPSQTKPPDSPQHTFRRVQNFESCLPGWQGANTRCISSFVLFCSFPTLLSTQKHAHRACSFTSEVFFSEFRSNTASVSSNTPTRPEATRLHKAKTKGKVCMWCSLRTLAANTKTQTRARQWSSAKIWIDHSLRYYCSILLDTTERLWFIPSVWLYPSFSNTKSPIEASVFSKRPTFLLDFRFLWNNKHQPKRLCCVQE